MEIEYEGYCRTVELKGLVFLFANWREGRIPHLQANNMWMKLNHAKKCVLKTWQLTTWLFFRVSISEKPIPLPKTLSIKKKLFARDKWYRRQAVPGGESFHSRERPMKQPAVIQTFSHLCCCIFHQCWLASSQNRFWGSCQEKPSWAGRDASSHWWRECGISNWAWKRGPARGDARCSLNDEWNTAKNKRLSMWCAQCSVWLVISWDFISWIGELWYLRMVEARRNPLKKTERVLFWRPTTLRLWMLLASYSFFSSNTHAFPISLVPKPTEKQSKIFGNNRKWFRYQDTKDTKMIFLAILSPLHKGGNVQQLPTRVFRRSTIKRIFTAQLHLLVISFCTLCSCSNLPLLCLFRGVVSNILVCLCFFLVQRLSALIWASENGLQDRKK